MASPPPSSSSSSMGADAPTKTTVSLFRNAMKRKHSFIQFFVMSGILFLSVRSLGQKYRIYDLQEDMASLQEEQSSILDRINHIKSSLRSEAELDSSGVFASRLRRLFGDDQ